MGACGLKSIGFQYFCWVFFGLQVGTITWTSSYKGDVLSGYGGKYHTANITNNHIIIDWTAAQFGNAHFPFVYRIGKTSEPGALKFGKIVWPKYWDPITAVERANQKALFSQMKKDWESSNDDFPRLQWGDHMLKTSAGTVVYFRKNKKVFRRQLNTKEENEFKVGFPNDGLNYLGMFLHMARLEP